MNEKILVEGKYGHGAVRDRVDTRDLQWSDIAGSSAPFDWNIGYDITKVIGRDLVTKDQGASSSCGGQAWSYYGEVLSAVFDKRYRPKSAKFIYAQTFVPGGGSGGRDNCNIAIKQGFADESVLSSYEQGNPPSEAFMERSIDITTPIRITASQDQALKYATVAFDIDSIAQAASINYGCVIGIVGQNNGTWESTRPFPPISAENTWDHWLYVGKASMMNGIKYIAVKNSWGDNVGDHGWQYISENYLKSGNFIFSVWTLTFKTPQPKHIFTAQMGLWSFGTEVYNLQQRLVNEGVATFSTPTGFFGGKTQESVMNYQIREKIIPVTGYVGPLTLAALNK